MKNALVAVSNGRLELELWFVSCQAENGWSDGRTDGGRTAGRTVGRAVGRTDGWTRALAQSANAFSQIKNRFFIWERRVRLDPPLSNKKPVLYLRERVAALRGRSNPSVSALSQRANPFSQIKNWFFIWERGSERSLPSQIKMGCYSEDAWTMIMI